MTRHRAQSITSQSPARGVASGRDMVACDEREVLAARRDHGWNTYRKRLHLLSQGLYHVTNHKHHAGYIFVAGICLVVHNVVMITADAAGFPLALAILTSFVIVAAGGYVMHCLFTFRVPLSWRGLQRYALAMSVNIFSAFALTWLWKDACSLPMVAAAPLASASTLVINFLLSRWAIVTPAKATVIQ